MQLRRQALIAASVLLLGSVADAQAPARRRAETSVPRLVVAALTSDDSLSRTIARRCSEALIHRARRSQLQVLAPADLDAILASGADWWGPWTMSDVFELMKLVRAQTAIEVRARRAPAAITVTAIRLRRKDVPPDTLPAISGATIGSVVDSLASRILRDTSIVGRVR